jgi:hypothetical protein
MLAILHKLHLAIDSKMFLPLAEVVVSADQNEKRPSALLVEKSKTVLAKLKMQLRSVIADSHYSSQELRDKAP